MNYYYLAKKSVLACNPVSFQVNAIYQDASLGANIKLVIARLLFYEHGKHGIIRPGNPKKSLENVNMWNRKLHSTLKSGQPKHDVAIWLTR